MELVKNGAFLILQKNLMLSLTMLARRKFCRRDTMQMRMKKQFNCTMLEKVEQFALQANEGKKAFTSFH